MSRRDSNSSVASTVERFFVADRDLGWLSGATSMAATQMSAGAIVGAVGIHYTIGVSFALTWVATWAGWLVSLLFVAPQLRRFGGVTVPEFLAARFDGDGADGRRTRAVSAVVIASVYLIYTSAQYVAGGVVVEALFGVPAVHAMVGLAGLATAYTTVGGLRASVVTDTIQVVALLLGVVVAAGVGLARVGGPGRLVRRATAVDPSLVGVGSHAASVLGFALAFGLSIAVAPYQISRVYALRSPATARPAILGSVVIQAVVAASVVVLGLLARVQFPDLATPDAAIVRIVFSYLGPVAGGLLMLAVLAAILSTLDSIFLVSASALAVDLYATVLGRGGRPEVADGRPATGLASLVDGSRDDVLLVARLGTVAAAVVPLALALNRGLLGGQVELIIALWAATTAGGLFAPVLLGIHSDGVTAAGALAGVVCGTLAVIAWALAGQSAVGPPLATLPPVVVGVVVSIVAVVVGSAVRPRAGG